MSRQASEYTEAIRNLLNETNGQVTHGKARPKLAELGFVIVDQPETISTELSTVDQYEYDKKSVNEALRFDDHKAINELLEHIWLETNLNEDQQKAVINEMKIRLAFVDERNNFDVTKHIWTQNRQSAQPSSSRKPESSKNKRAVAAITKQEFPRPKHRVETVSLEPTRRVGRPRKNATPDATELLALELVEKFGGVSHVADHIEKMNAEIEKLQSAIDLVASLQERIRAAA